MILLKRKYSALPTDVSVPNFESGCSTTTIVPSDRPVEIYKKLKVTQEQSNILEMAAVASALLNRKKKEYDQDLTRLGKNYERIRGIMYQLNIQISSVVNTRCCAICTKQLGKLKMIQCINNLQSKVETCMKHLTRTRFIVNSNSLIISSESCMERFEDAQTTKAFMQGRLDLIRKQKNNVLRQRRCEYCRSNVPNQELARFLQQSDQLACYLAHKLQ